MGGYRKKLCFLLHSIGAVALAEVLADSLTITRIDIRENHLQVAGLMAFAMALKVNQSLVRLDLDKDIKKEPVSLILAALQLSLSHHSGCRLYSSS